MAQRSESLSSHSSTRSTESSKDTTHNLLALYYLVPRLKRAKCYEKSLFLRRMVQCISSALRRGMGMKVIEVLKKANVYETVMSSIGDEPRELRMMKNTLLNIVLILKEINIESLNQLDGDNKSVSSGLSEADEERLIRETEEITRVIEHEEEMQQKRYKDREERIRQKALKMIEEDERQQLDKEKMLNL
ncbi:MAG: hypothetical protein EZS28_037814, partial [Streblomastix strix]